MNRMLFLAIPKEFTRESLVKRLAGLADGWEFVASFKGSVYSLTTDLPYGELRYVSGMEGYNPRPEAWMGFLEFSYYPEHHLLFRVLSLSIAGILSTDTNGALIEFGTTDEVFSYVKERKLVINERFKSFYPVNFLEGFKHIEFKVIPTIDRSRDSAYPTFENDTSAL